MFTFIKKEVIHIFRDARTLLVLFGMPVIMVLLFGFAITNDIKNINIAVLDKSKDAMSVQLFNNITASPYFNGVKNLSSESEIEAAFRTGELKSVIVIGENFSQKLLSGKGAPIELILDASDPNTASLISSYLKVIIATFVQQTLGLSPEQASPIHIESRMLYNPELKSVYMFVPGILTVILMLISSLLTSITLTREKELGTMEVLLASPIKPMNIIIGKVAPYAILAFGISCIILFLSTTVFNMPIHGSILLLLAENLLFILLSLALGLFISTVTETQQAAMLIAMAGLLLPTILLSGFIFPIENMPEALQIFSHAMPSKWFIIVIKNIMLKGVGIAFCWKETLIMVGMTLFFFLMSWKNFKLRLQ